MVSKLTVCIVLIFLRCKGATEKSYEGHKGSTNSSLPAAKVVSEHADHWRAKEDHAHG